MVCFSYCVKADKGDANNHSYLLIKLSIHIIFRRMVSLYVSLHHFTLFLIHDSIPKQLHIGEIARYVLHKFQIVVSAIFPLVIIGLYGNTVLVLKDRVEQRAVRIAARMPHYQNLEGCHKKKLQQVVIVFCFQIPHRLNVFEKRIVILVKDGLVVFVKFIAIAKDDILWMFKLAMNIVVHGAEIGRAHV